MEKVERIELYHVSIPLPKPFYPSWIPGYPQTHNRSTLLRLTTSGGLEGIAAGVAFERERQGLGCLLGPYLLGLDAEDIATVKQRLREASYLGWRNSWVEAAFWDIKAKIQGKPLYRILQEREEVVTEVPVYCSTGEVRPILQRLKDLEHVHTMGFRAVKLRVHAQEVQEDLDHLREVAQEVGDRLSLMVDANQGWPVSLIQKAPLWNLERAITFSKACEDHGILWLEEPLDMHAYEQLAVLRTRTTTPIAGGELNAGWHEFKIMLEKGSLDIYQPDATMAGGISDSIKVMKACREQGLSFSPHTWTNGIGFLVNLQLYAAWPERKFLEYPFEPPAWIPAYRDAILAHPIEVSSKGTVLVPQTPGTGIMLDRKALATYGRRFYRITPFHLALHMIRQKGIGGALELKKAKERHT